jgi:hypothetical protein
MSGVLDRMVARTRGDLSTVEPLIKPRFEAVTAKMPQEVATEKPRRIPTGSQPRIPAQHPDLVSTAQAEKHETSKRSAASSAVVQLPDTVVNPTRKSAATAKSPRASDPIVMPHAEERSISPSREGRLSTPTMATKTGAGTAGTAIDEHRNSASKEEEMFRPAGWERDPEIKLSDGAGLQVPTEHDLASAFTDESQAPPEIRISIGSIELQVAPRQEYRSAPSFRPRVSLDSFLGRGRG